MRVIFLDHDGVICLASEWGSRHKKQKKWRGLKLSMTPNEIPLQYRFDNFNAKALEVLNKILEKTGAEIVVSSDWKRFSNLEQMGDYYLSQGIAKKPIAFTPDLSQCTWHEGKEFAWLKNWDLEQSRAIEIQQYLQDHNDVTHWVAIDDLDMGRSEAWKDWGLTNFVLSPRENEGIKQSGIGEKMLQFLNA